MNYRYVFKELRYHRHRTLVNVLGIAVGIALFVSINAVATAYQDAVSLPFKNLGADLVVQRPEKHGANAAQTPEAMRGIRLPFSNQILPPADLKKLASINGIASMATSLLLWEFDRSGFRTIMGIDLSQPNLGPVKVKSWLKKGRFPEHQGEAILEKHYAKFHRTQLGDMITIGGNPFKVVGLLEIKEGSQIAAANIYLPLKDAQMLVKEPNGVNVVYLRLQNPSLMTTVKTQIGKELKGVSVTSSDSFLELMGGVSKISDQFSMLVSLIALGGAIFLIIKTMLANLVARSNEIGILKAVGWTEKDVQRQLMGEALLQCLAGGILGLIIGYSISYALGFLSIQVSTPWEINLLPAFAKEAQSAASRMVQLPVHLSAGLTFAALGLSLAAGAAASFFMGRRTARMKPADILRRL
ncbi:MAG: ABC transporter permease [Syntrophobacterales bacterium]|jgi:ABC-type antimicrobial peptide transport system permease subunit